MKNLKASVQCNFHRPWVTITAYCLMLDSKSIIQHLRQAYTKGIRGTMVQRIAIAALLAIIPLSNALGASTSSARIAQAAAAALVRGETSKAVARYTEALNDTSLTNDRRATILNDRAVAYARLGQTKLAIDDFNRAVRLFPEYAAIYNNRGSLLLALENPNEAIKDFNRAIALAPGYAAAFSNRGGAYAKAGDNDQAMQDFTRAIKLMPRSAAPLSGRGRVHLAVGRPFAAIRDFTRAVNADARFAAAYRNRAEAKLDIDQQQDAIEDLSRAIAFDVNNAELYLLRGQAYLAKDKVASALKDFSRAAELNPSMARAYAARGLANGYLGDFEKSFADLNRAIELDPRSGLAFAYRAVVYKENGQADVGLRDAETALKLDPEGAEARWARGEIAEAQGRIEEAIADFKQALVVKPSLKRAANGLKRLGADLGSEEDRLIDGLGLRDWQVVARGSRYYAVSKRYRRIRVPLEMAGEGQPRLLEWEVKRRPLSGIALLRFSAGVARGPKGPEKVEQVAILDLQKNKVIAIEPHRQGKKVSTWTWRGDRVVVASVDGATDEFVLRTVRARERRRNTYGGGWGGPWAQYDAPPGSSRPKRRRKKPKTLFQFLFQ